MNCNKINDDAQPIYELECSYAIYDCLVLIITPHMQLAKRQIIENFSNLNITKYIINFKPYKSRLMLNVPLLQRIVCNSLYSILNQFYEINSNNEYYVIRNSGATHEDVDDLVVKITTILSNKLLGKNIINYVESADTRISYL